MFLIGAILDIFATSFILYNTYILLKKTRSIYILRGFVGIAIFYVIVGTLNLKLTVYLLQFFISFAIIILAVVFQREIRRFFENFSLSFFYDMSAGGTQVNQDLLSVIINTAYQLSQKKIGALIVFPGKQNLDNLLEGGIDINGKVSEPLLLSIFDTRTPGHDGAVIIENNLIKKFSVHLPLAEDHKKYPNIGTRHRAGLGVAEKSDASTIIISEERGTITMARNNELFLINGKDELKNELEKVIKTSKDSSKIGVLDNFKKFLKNNRKEKIFVVTLSIFLWCVIAYK